MTERMSDERLAEIENDPIGWTNEMGDELLAELRRAREAEASTQPLIDGFQRELFEVEKERDQFREELEDWRESARVTLEEPCGDEKHCTCVPTLRARVAELEEGIQTLATGLAEPAWGEEGRALYDHAISLIDKPHGSVEGGSE